MVELGRGVFGVQRHSYGAGPPGGEDGDGELATGSTHDRHPLAAAIDVRRAELLAQPECPFDERQVTE